jgi:hypothetical protein
LIQAIAKDESNTNNFHKIFIVLYEKIGDKLKSLSTTADPIPGFNLYREDVLKGNQNDEMIEPKKLDSKNDIFNQLLLAQPMIKSAEEKYEQR